MLKLIVFDWDDVIILGSKEGYYNCYRETLKELGVVLDEKEMDIRIRRKWGQPFRIELAELLQEQPHLINKACEIFYDKKFQGFTFVDSLKEVEGVNELLIRLKKTYKLAVATGNKLDMIKEKIIPKFNIPDVFDQIITAHDDVPEGKSKPDPYMIQIILERQGVLPNEAIYVGDADNDVLMANNAGVMPVVVLTGHLSRDEAEKLGVKYIISDVSKLEDVLKILNQ
ncbi:hypothetical protein COV87_03390 [Candidatus Roizmanbacteria bacterium CG11_big_fil_rev_8_21_14_0_20_37_16]|uniref:HAD family hydrolase n=1 Tax=Candidatus Roizmanbacteria bacterium CG11_big_fil_rev_8_21_14_0_20_37_16 TaxID=1974857 RepID=A0A2H0KJP1_9BACT|nr:MAG: hypothetical protein COV87_03390 [Candidatus Roizmanbacteria bacterium CG11_big_fil_rev_8_21_14_0_20_37_16]